MKYILLSNKLYTSNQCNLIHFFKLRIGHAFRVANFPYILIADRIKFLDYIKTTISVRVNKKPSLGSAQIFYLEKCGNISYA